jgi:hypothetical protein
MVVKYVFSEDDIQADHSIKKRKLSDSKLKSLIDYSQIKLPAAMFLHYLENYGSQFVNECIRYIKIYLQIILWKECNTVFFSLDDTGVHHHAAEQTQEWIVVFQTLSLFHNWCLL